MLKNGMILNLLKGLLICLALLSKEVTAETGQSVDNIELQALYDQDQRARTPNASTSDVATTDLDRRLAVFQMLAVGDINSATDKFRAARILHHTSNTYCGWPVLPKTKTNCSRSPENYFLAHKLALEALSMGQEEARPLVPRTIDRYLAFTEGHQKYGTVIVRNHETGQFMLPYIDRDTTDSERANYGIRPLAETLKKYKEMPAPDRAK